MDFEKEVIFRLFEAFGGYIQRLTSEYTDFVNIGNKLIIINSSGHHT